jgi:MFS family permease
MFSHVMNLAYTRTGKQVVGFYIIWFLIFVVAGGIVAGIGFILIGPPGGADSQAYEVGWRIGSIVAVIACTGLAARILIEKKFHPTYKNVLYIIGTLILAALGGSLLGLLIPTYLTSLKEGMDVEKTETTTPSSETSS